MAQGKESDEAAAENLRLIALDAEDLAVLAAHLQDAILRVGDMIYLPDEQRFVIALNRFDWLSATIRRAAKDANRAAFREGSESRHPRIPPGPAGRHFEPAQHRLHGNRPACGNGDFDLFRRLRVAA